MTKVFVYGTLKRGYGNNWHFLRGARFVGHAVTTGAFSMLCTGSFPVVLPGRTAPVVGEVYEVDRETLAALDRLEGKGFMYDRELVEVRLLDGVRRQRAWMYVGKSYWVSQRGVTWVAPTAGGLRWRP